MSAINNTPNHINQKITVDQFGNINTNLYIHKARELRKKAIINQFTALVKSIKLLAKANEAIVKNVKAA